MESRRVREVVGVRSQEEVAAVLGISQRTVCRLEARAFCKLRRNPKAWYLLRRICQENLARISPSIIEPNIWHEIEKELEMVAALKEIHEDRTNTGIR